MDETIAAIYRAGSGVQPWDDALTRIVDKLGIMGSQMVGVSSRTGGVLFSHAAAGAPSDAELEYVRVYHAEDPRIPLLLSSRPGSWLYDQDVFDDRIGLTNPYYRELLIPYGARYSASAKLLDNEGEVTLVAFLAQLGSEGFTQSHRILLDTVGYHLREAAAIYQKTRALLTTSFAGASLLNRMTRPAFLISVDRSVTYMNEAARSCAAAQRPLALRRDRLVASDSKAERELAAAIEGLLSSSSEGVALGRPIVRLGPAGAAWSVAVSLTKLVPQQTMYAFGSLPLLLVLVHARTDRTQEPDILLWEAALNLTPAQSRVARQIYRGCTMKEAARNLKIAESTVRTHLNEVYAKTNTTRQAQLVLALAALGA